LTALGATNGYVCDRWGVFRSGYATGAQVAQGINLTTGDLPLNECGITTFARMGRVLSNALTNALFIAYALETQDSIKFKGKNVTISGYYRTGANFSGTQLTFRITTGTGIDEALQRGGSVTGQVNYSAVFPINTSWSKFTYTTKLETTINQIGIYIIYDPVGTAGAADYFDITGVQLELGSVATPFEVRPYQVEFGLCLRYYYKINNTHVGYIISSSFLYGGRIDYKTVMRTGISNFEGGVFVVSGGNAGTVGLAGQTTEWAIPYNSANNWTPGNACYLQNAGVNAEL